MPDQFDALCARFFDCDVQRNVSMAQYTSFRTGGCARALVEPRSVEALQNALFAVHEYGIPYEVIVYRERPLRSTVRSGLVTLALLFIIYLFIVCKRRSS